MTDFCPCCGQTTLGDFEARIVIPKELNAEALGGQLARRRSVFEAVDRYLGYRLEDRLEQDPDFLPRLCAMFEACSVTLDQYRSAQQEVAKGNTPKATTHSNLMAEGMLQIAAECVWMIAEYGYPLVDNVPALLRRLTAEDNEIGD